MAKDPKRFQLLEQYVTYGLIADTVLFVLYLLFAGLGVIFLKVLLALLILGLSSLCLAVLYLNGELLRQRSLWMTCGAAAIILCLVVSLIANYPG